MARRRSFGPRGPIQWDVVAVHALCVAGGVTAYVKMGMWLLG